MDNQVKGNAHNKPRWPRRRRHPRPAKADGGSETAGKRAERQRPALRRRRWIPSTGDRHRYSCSTPRSARARTTIIADFNVADDTIGLDNAVFTALTTVPGLTARAASTEFGSLAAPGHLRPHHLQQPDRSLFYDSDGRRRPSAVLFASVQPGLAITASDFFVM